MKHSDRTDRIGPGRKKRRKRVAGPPRAATRESGSRDRRGLPHGGRGTAAGCHVDRPRRRTPCPQAAKAVAAACDALDFSPGDRAAETRAGTKRHGAFEMRLLCARRGADVCFSTCRNFGEIRGLTESRRRRGLWDGWGRDAAAEGSRRRRGGIATPPRRGQCAEAEGTVAPRGPGDSEGTGSPLPRRPPPPSGSWPCPRRRRGGASRRAASGAGRPRRCCVENGSSRPRPRAGVEERWQIVRGRVASWIIRGLGRSDAAAADVASPRGSAEVGSRAGSSADWVAATPRPQTWLVRGARPRSGRELDHPRIGSQRRRGRRRG